MPIDTVSLPDVHETVSRPVIMQVAKQVMELTGLPEDTRIYFKGKSESIATPGATMDTRKDREARFQSRRQLYVEATETYSLEDISRIRTAKNDSIPVFADTRVGIYVRPVYITSNIELNVRFITHSETDAKRWLSDMMVKADKGRVINIHSVAYDCPLLDPIVELIEEAWKRMDKVASYGESFPEYFRRCASRRLTLKAKRDGKGANLAIRERQGRIQGSYGFVGVPGEATKDNGNGTWEVSFSYTFSYQRPEQLQVEFPILVHSQLLPAKFTGEDDRTEDPDVKAYYYGNDMVRMSQFEATRDEKTRQSRPYPIVPHWDHYKPVVFQFGTASLIQILVTPDLDDKVSLMNLQDLGDWAFDPDIWEFMVKSEQPYMTKLYESIFHISLYEGDEVYDVDKVVLSPTMGLSTSEPLDLRKVYRVSVRIVEKLSLLSQEARDRLKNWPGVLEKILNAMEEVRRGNPDFTPARHYPDGMGEVGEPVYPPWWQNGTQPGWNPGEGWDIGLIFDDLIAAGIPMKTTQTSWLISRRIEEMAG